MAKPSFAVLLYPLCTFHEVASAVYLLSSYGGVVFVSRDGGEVVTSEGLALATTPIRTLECEGLRALLVPGGDCHSIHGDASLRAELQRLASSPELVVGGICNGALVLADTGLLADRACTHTAHPSWADPVEFKELLAAAEAAFAGCAYRDEDVVVDRGVITAKPWASAAFAVAVGDAAGLLDEQAVAAWTRTLSGTAPER